MRRKLEFRYLLFLLISFLLFNACQQSANKKNPPKAINGVLDLKDWDFEKDGTVDLSGDYQFYWQQYLPPEELSRKNHQHDSEYIPVPGSWNNHKIGNIPLTGIGYATYHVSIQFSETPSILAFKFLDMATAFSAYANGKLLLAVGEVGTNKETAQPSYQPQVVDFIPDSNQIELVFHVSNFHHKKGGAWEVIQLGLPQDIHRAREKQIALDLFLFGALFLIGLYHFVLYLLRPEDKSVLYFALFCVLISVKILTTFERFIIILYPEISWELLVRLDYLSVYIAVPIFGMLIHSLLQAECSTVIIRIVQFIGIAFSSIVLFTPVFIFSHVVVVYQIYVILCFLYGIYVLVLGIQQKIKGASLVLGGFFVMFVASVYDILNVNEITVGGQLIGVGFFIFVFAQAAWLAIRYATAFQTVRSQRHLLTQTNKGYQKEIKERIEAEKEKKELQAALIRSRKMEALGLLAGGVAHDLNNVLSAIVTYPELLLLDLPKESRLRKPLLTIQKSGARAAEIVQDLLTLTRQGIVNQEVVNLNQIIEDYIDSPEHQGLVLAHQNIDIETALDSQLFNMNGSPIHLRKMIMNLIFNAAEAQLNGGEIIVSTHNTHFDKPFKGYQKISAGDYIVLSIKDKGIGIPTKDLERIFEPFYTKKVMGRSGTGLGMAVVWGTVQDHKGGINIQSKENNGSTFEFYFPMVRETVLKQGTEISLETYLGKGEKILVIDDVPEQLEIASGILERLGYTVVTMNSGEAAIEYMQNNSADLLLLDMIMDPGIGGLETYQGIIKHHPKMKAIIASGYSETERVKKAQELGVGRYIKKPYTLENLAVAVKTELVR